MVVLANRNTMASNPAKFTYLLLVTVSDGRLSTTSTATINVDRK
jgi:hypothetical protein